jgi:oligoendopeptidase F
MAFVRLFNEELSLKRFRTSNSANGTTASESELLGKLRVASRSERKKAATFFTRGLHEESRRLTFIFNTLARDKQVEDRYRHFATPEAARHIDNETTQETVDALAGAVAASYGMVQDFYRFKQKLLKVDTLYDYDRYAPLPGAAQRFSFEEAKKIILTAFGSFSPAMATIAKEFFDKKWIDAAPRNGKRSGAFCMFVTPDLHPYVLVNYQEKADDVMTLAHELGHGIHAYLARKQHFLNFYMPLTVAETASVFGEMLVFDHLRRTLKRPEDRFALIVGKIESIFATVHRQISMYRFEQDLHKNIQTEGELTTERISALWRTRQQEMFDKAVTLTKDYDIWWSYISHFIHTPFYVYSYAFGELLTLALFARYQTDGSKMAAAYLDLLEKGGSESPDDLVKAFGINLRDKAFWEGGLKMIQDLIDEAKALHQSR